MAVSIKWYGNALKNICKGGLNWMASGGSTVKCVLLTSTYTPNQDTHEFYSHLTNELTTTGGYTAGGLTLTKVDVSYDGASNETRLDCNDPSWANATFTCRYAVFYISTGVAGTSALLCYIDFGANQSPSGVTFVIQLAATGALKLTAA